MAWVATAVVGALGTTGTAVLGAAAVGAIASNRASKRAAEGQEEALEATTAATAQARGDITQLFGEAGEARGEAFGKTLEFISGAPSKQITPFQRGNVLAQEQISRGLPQIERAILGQPTDLSGFTARSVGAPESFNFDLSQFRRPETLPASRQPTTQATPQFDLSGIGRRAVPRIGFDSVNRLPRSRLNIRER